jgi:hypothetical protein
VQAVDTGLVMKAIEPDLDDEARNRFPGAGRIESILDWATTRGYRQAKPGALARASENCCRTAQGARSSTTPRCRMPTSRPSCTS